MANYANLLATIAANIYTNGNNEVTAAMVKTAVDQMVASLGAGYQFMGIATPSTTPGSTDIKQFYIASEPGTYTDFLDSGSDPLEVNDGEMAVLKYDTAWSKESVDLNRVEISQNNYAIFESGGINGAPGRGENVVDPTRIRTKFYIPVDSLISIGNFLSVSLLIVFYDKDFVCLGYNATTQYNFTHDALKTAFVGAEYIRIVQRDSLNDKILLFSFASLTNKNDLNSTESNSSMYLRGLVEKTYSSTKKKCILVAGQSNTEGRVPESDFPVSFVDENGVTIDYLNAQGIMVDTQFMDKKINGTPFVPWSFDAIDNSAGRKWGYDAITLKRLQHYLNDVVYEIKWALGSTPIAVIDSEPAAWTPRVEELEAKFGNTADPLILKLEESYRKAKALYDDFEVIAVLWHQGEDDAQSDQSAEDYYYNFKDVINYIRGFVGNVKLPFIFGTISKNSDVYADEQARWELITAAQAKIAFEDGNVYIVNMANGTMLDEGYKYHFDAASSIYLGTRMYDIIKNNIL